MKKMATTPHPSGEPRFAIPKLQMSLIPRNEDDFVLSSEIRDRLLRRALCLASDKAASSSSFAELSASPSSSTFPSSPTPHGITERGSRPEFVTSASRSASSGSFSATSLSSDTSEPDLHVISNDAQGHTSANHLRRRSARKPVVKPKGVRLARSSDPRSAILLPSPTRQDQDNSASEDNDNDEVTTESNSNSENSFDGELEAGNTSASTIASRKIAGRFSLRRADSDKRSASARFAAHDQPRLRQEKTTDGPTAKHNRRQPIILESTTSSFIEEEQSIDYPSGEFDARTQATPLIVEHAADFYRESAAAVSSRTIVSKTPGLRWFPRYFLSHPYYLGVGKHSFLGILIVMYLKISSDSIRTIYMNQMGVECRLLDGRFLEQHKLNSLLLTKAAKREWQSCLIRKISPSLAGVDCDFHPRVARLPAIEERILSLTTMHPSEMLRLDVFKFGVISYTDDMLDQHAILLNNEVSPAFDQFLMLLGQPHPTSDSERYRGGLSPAEGEVFLSTCFGRFEIAFHVAQWLKPCGSQNNLQVIEPEEERQQLYLLRKRHIGNDSVVVVFHEGNKPFDPNCIKTQYTQVYIVIQHEPSSSPPRYRVSISAKDGVQPWFPAVPEFTWYPANDSFRALLIDKLIGAQQSCYISPLFQKRFVKSRTLLLEEIWETVVNSRPSR